MADHNAEQGAVAEVINRHLPLHTEMFAYCRCGEWDSKSRLTWSEHVAEALQSVIAAAQAEALRAQARQFRDVAGGVWGGDERWLTTGSNVADLVAGWCDDTAETIEEEARDA